MNRRDFISLAAASVVAPAGRLAAETSCRATPFGELCRSEVDFARFAQEAFEHQYQSQWCWAASISMVFAHYGHRVSQERIVREVSNGRVERLFNGVRVQVSEQVRARLERMDRAPTAAEVLRRDD
jgi:hypothetical protein